MARAKASIRSDLFQRGRTCIGGKKHIRPLFLAVTLTVALAGCTEGDKPSPSSAARVNGQIILVSDVTDALDRFEDTGQFDQLAEQGGRAEARSQFERMYLVQQIKRLVLKSRADALGIDIRDEVTKRVEQAKGSYSSEKEFRKVLEASGYTLAEFSSLIDDQVLEEELREEVTGESEPSGEELRQYYASNRKDYDQTEVQHILVKRMALASEISTKLHDASVDELGRLFAQLAHEHSTDASNSDSGGRLGWVSPGDLVAPFETSMNKLDIREESEPVRTDFGVHLILVTDRRQLSFEDARDEISKQLIEFEVAEAWNEWLKDAYDRADIELNPRYGKLDRETGQIVAASANDSSG
jgi:foldase protein PrsA